MSQVRHDLALIGGGHAPSVRVLPLRLNDLDVLREMEMGAYEFPWSQGNLLESLTHDPIKMGLWIDTRLIGYLFAQVVLNELHLLNFTIHRSWQRQGWGSYLLARLLETARSHPCVDLYLEVRRSNLPAIALYQKAGFRQVGLRPGYYPAHQGREDALIMHCAL